MEFDCAKNFYSAVERCNSVVYEMFFVIGAVKLHLVRILVGSVAHFCGSVAHSNSI